MCSSILKISFSRSRKFFCAAFFLLLTTLFPVFDTVAGSPDYPGIFGEHWDDALEFVRNNRAWMDSLCREHKTDYLTAVSVVFPELVRYSAVRDKIELTLLKALYVNKGTEYSDFSVGVFQIKPSCAENVLAILPEIKERKLLLHFRGIHIGLNEKATRMKITRELEDPRSAFLYVIGILKYLDKTCIDRNWESPEDKIRYYAAAYNSGFSNPDTGIGRQMNILSFHTGILKPAECYSYSDISATYYQILKSARCLSLQ